MRAGFTIFLGLCLSLPAACRPQPNPAARAVPVAGGPDFDRMLSRSVTQPRHGMHWVEWDLSPEDHRMLEAACVSPARFDRLLDRVAEIPDPSFPGCFFRYSHEGMKDCPLGEEYVAGLADRLLKEERPKHRKALRDAIQWHSFHEHARSWSALPYEKSAAAIIRRFVRRDDEDARWYGVVQANYAPRYPEAAAEMWGAIRAEAERQDGLLIIGAFETAFNGLRRDSRYRQQFLDECLRLVKEAREQANPWAAGWMLKRQILHVARGGFLSWEVFDWESALLEAAALARSQAHRGDAILVLLSMGSLRVTKILNEWLEQGPPDAVLDSFLSELRISEAGPKDLLSEVDHPRVRARLTIGREILKRNWNGEPSAVTYLLGVLKTDPRSEMRQEALRELACTLRDDPRDKRDHLPQGMSNNLDLLDVVLADPSLSVRKVLAEALNRHRNRFDDLPPKRRAVLNRLLESVK